MISNPVSSAIEWKTVELNMLELNAMELNAVELNSSMTGSSWFCSGTVVAVARFGILDFITNSSSHTIVAS